MVEEALQGGGIEDLYLHGGGEVLPDPRWAEEQVGPDLPDVLSGGLGALGEVHGEAEEHAAGDAHHLLADPGEREEADELVGLQLGVHLPEVGGHGEHVAVGEDRQLGVARGARSDADVSGILRLGGVHQGIVGAWVGLLVRLAQGLDLQEGDEPGVIVFSHPTGVRVDDVLHRG